MRGDRALKVEVERVGGVESQTVNVKLFDPPCDRFQKMIANGWISEVEFHQVVVLGPSFVMKRLAVRAAAREVEVIPVAVRRRAPLFTNVAKCPEVAPRVMEDRIEHQANSTPMQLAAERGERRFVAEAPVHVEIVGDVVAVRARFEHGAEK